MGEKKTELLVTAASIEEVERLFRAGADAVEVGNERYALRAAGNFMLPDIAEAVKIAHQYKGRIYVLMNALLHNEVLDGLEQYLHDLQEIGVDAIVFGDPAVYMAAKATVPDMKLHWNTETTSTNYRTVNYWARKGVRRAILARELSLEEVIGIKQNTDIEVQAQVHGMTCIFHSKRELVSNYMSYQGKDLMQEDRRITRRLYVKQDQRDNERYPIFEDAHGTHIMSSEDLCMLEHLAPLVREGVDSLKIEGILKPIPYNETVVSIYRKAIDRLAEDPNGGIDPNWMEEIRAIQEENRPLGTGFYFKASVY